MKRFILGATVIVLSCLNASAGQKINGRLVVFADKKVGPLKADKSIKAGTTESIDQLKLVEDQKGVHACFVGSPDSIKPILSGMIANSNKSQEDLKLQTFETNQKESTIHLQVMSQSKKSVYLDLDIGPC